MVAPGEQETGWKTPPQLRIGGDFTIAVNLVIRKLPKPAQEDGAAVGVAISQQDINQPDVTFVRLLEPTGADVYRSIVKTTGNPMQMQMQMQMRMQMQRHVVPPGAKPPKPPRPTFPAEGDAVRLELEREGNTIRFHVVEGANGQPRYLGQVALGPNDVAAVKVFASNRNGAEAVNVLVRDVSIRADRLQGLGTVVRTVFDSVVYADPTAIEGRPDRRRSTQDARTQANPEAKPGPANAGESPQPKAAPAGPPVGAVFQGPNGLTATVAAIPAPVQAQAPATKDAGSPKPAAPPKRPVSRFPASRRKTLPRTRPTPLRNRRNRRSRRPESPSTKSRVSGSSGRRSWPVDSWANPISTSRCPA